MSDGSPVGPAGAAIRPLAPGDLAALQAVRAAAFAPVFASFRALLGAGIAEIALAEADADQARLLAEIAAGGSGHELLVVTLDQEVVGFVAFTIDAGRGIGEIGLNAVHPAHQGRGLGTWMYGQVIARMAERGMALATVGTGGDPGHAAARRAYAKAGFGTALPSIHLYRLLADRADRPSRAGDADPPPPGAAAVPGGGPDLGAPDLGSERRD
jgi:GNAT superfamily N-acetyltransferase